MYVRIYVCRVHGDMYAADNESLSIHLRIAGRWIAISNAFAVDKGFLVSL
jgi:hypothetical protein